MKWVSRNKTPIYNTVLICNKVSTYKGSLKTVTHEPIRSHVQGSTVLINLMTDYSICSSCDALSMVNK